MEACYFPSPLRNPFILWQGVYEIISELVKIVESILAVSLGNLCVSPPTLSSLTEEELQYPMGYSHYSNPALYLEKDLLQERLITLLKANSQ